MTYTANLIKQYSGANVKGAIQTTNLIRIVSDSGSVSWIKAPTYKGYGGTYHAR